MAVVVLWVSEALPIAATALLIAPLMVLLGVTDVKTAFAPYADPLLFLFVGGFMIAQAMARHGLDRRIALRVLALPMLRGSGARTRLAFMVVGVVLSMWISNTATTAILLPIVIGVLGADEHEGVTPAEKGALLSVAYACSIGGLGTPVGSPPNLIALRFLREAGVEFTFLDWVALGLPAAFVMVLVIFIAFQKRFPASDASILGVRLDAPMTRGEKVTLAAFLFAVVGWMGPGILKALDAPHSAAIAKALPGGGVALLAATILFAFRDGKDGERVLPWSDAARIDWGIIMLFGGGISLGTQMFDSGLAAYLSRSFVELTGVTHLWVLTALVTFFTLFFTETCSNTATANMLAPLVLGIATELKLPPTPLVLAVGLAASCAFMLPIATGPNAIVYGTGRVTMGDMMRTGFWLNLAAGVIIVAWLFVFCTLRGLV